jgi:AcrR family transcriptional regulator
MSILPYKTDMSVLPSGAARAKRTYLKADKRRAQILDVAKAVFAHRGYRLANVADICAAARIGRGTLYQYFANKQDVLLALMEDLADRVERVLQERPTVENLKHARELPVEMVVSFCQKRLRQLLEAIFVDEPTLRLVLREARGLDGAVDQVIEMIDNLVFDAVEADVRAAQEAGLFRRGDSRLATRFLLGGVEKLVLFALQEDGPIDLDAIVTAAVEMELFGLYAPQLEKPAAATKPRKEPRS